MQTRQPVQSLRAVLRCRAGGQRRLFGRASAIFWIMTGRKQCPVLLVFAFALAAEAHGPRRARSRRGRNPCEAILTSDLPRTRVGDRRVGTAAGDVNAIDRRNIRLVFSELNTAGTDAPALPQKDLVIMQPYGCSFPKFWKPLQRKSWRGRNRR
jgi:hypothetical protein